MSLLAIAIFIVVLGLGKIILHYSYSGKEVTSKLKRLEQLNDRHN